MTAQRLRVRPMALVALSAVAIALTGCGPQAMVKSTTGDPSATAPATATTVALPTSVPAAPGLVTTRGPVTVLDDGSGAQLCLGGMLESLPPQCGGPPIIGWDWAEHDGDYDDASGTRWGAFVLKGSFDGSTMTPSEIVPADKYTASSAESPERRTTSCPEPGGGWVVDASRLTQNDFDAAFRNANRLDDYASSFVDLSGDPRSPEQMDSDAADGNEDLSAWIVNVRVTEDPAAAEATIREVWGGGVCITTVAYTDRELRSIQRDVMGVPGFLSGGVGDDAVRLGVIYDDGSIQTWAHEEYGADVVVVTGALTDVT